MAESSDATRKPQISLFIDMKTPLLRPRVLTEARILIHRQLLAKECGRRLQLPPSNESWKRAHKVQMPLAEAAIRKRVDHYRIFADVACGVRRAFGQPILSGGLMSR